MKKPKKMRGAGVVLAIGLSGCGVEHGAADSRPEATRVTAVDGRVAIDRSVQQSLDRLNGLKLFTARRLVMKLPANASDCYGVPCPGNTEGQAAYDVELARQAARLSKLTDQAEACNSGNCYVITPDSAEQAVRALNALEIVQVGSLLVAEPQNNPSCYNLPCESDVRAANEENQRRMTQAFSLASYAKDI